MPKADSTPASVQVKALILGDSGAGKSGALVSLAEAGYKLFILDFDAGVQPIIEFASPKAKGNIVFETLKDKVGWMVNIMKATNPTAISKGMNLLNRWKDSVDGTDYGVPENWGPDHIVVIDSLSFLGKAALAFVMHKNSQSVPRIQDWGEAMNIISGLLAQLTAPSFKPHVLVLTHVNYLENEENVVYKGVPQSLGKSLNTEIPKYFNIVLGVTRRGAAGAKIQTQPSGFVDYKFPKAGVKPDYPLTTGLREIFKFLRGTEPVETPAASTLQKA